MDRYGQMLRAAQDYHQKHPEVWDYFVQFTIERINQGFKHYSARGIFHRIRWRLLFLLMRANTRSVTIILPFMHGNS